MLRVLSIFTLLEGVDLHPEGHTLLTPVLPRGELGADAVHLRRMPQAVSQRWARVEVRNGAATGVGPSS